MKSFGSLVSSKPPCSCPRRMTAICFNNVPVHASFPKTNRLHQYTHVLCAITPGPSRLIIISRNDSIDLFRFPADYQSRFRGAVHKSDRRKRARRTRKFDRVFLIQRDIFIPGGFRSSGVRYCGLNISHSYSRSRFIRP